MKLLVGWTVGIAAFVLLLVVWIVTQNLLGFDPFKSFPPMVALAYSLAVPGLSLYIAERIGVKAASKLTARKDL